MYCLYRLDRSVEEARTLTFSVMVMLQLFHAFNCRSNRYSLMTLGLGTNEPLLWAVGGSALLQAAIVWLPWTRNVFSLAPLTAELWMLIFGVGMLPLLAMEAWKLMHRSSQPLPPR